MSNSDGVIYQVEAWQNLTRQYHEQSTHCKEVASFLQDLDHNKYWQSEAATTFSRNMEQYIGVLQKFEQGFEALAKELGTRIRVAQESRNV